MWILVIMNKQTTKKRRELEKSLPRKMIIGISTLSFSIAAMMTAFSAALFLMLHEQSWIFKPVIYLASIPITLFVLMQFPLLVAMEISTYRPSIFEGKWSVSFNIFIICVLLIWWTSVLLIIGIYQPNMKVFLSLFFFSVIQIMGHSFLFFVEMSLRLH